MGVLTELLASHDEADKEIKEIVAKAEAETRDLTPEEETRSTELLCTLDELAPRIEEETRKAARAKAVAEARKLAGTTTVTAEVVDEKMVYGPDSPNSYFADRIAQARGVGDPRFGQACERLAEWGHQVEKEIASDSKEGRAALKQIRETYRQMGPEQTRSALSDVQERGRVARELKEDRSIASGGGASASAASGGAAFVTPVFFVDEYAPYREYGRAFADQVNKQPLPDYGMNVYIPAVTGPAGVREQTPEGDPVNETDPTFGYLSGSLITLAGEVTVSQQLLDRAGPNFSFDRMIFDQLMRDYAPQLDTYALNTALTGAQTVSWSGNSNVFDLNVTSGSGGFYGQVSKAKAFIRTYAGTVLNPTHLFLQPARWEFIAAWADANGRPVVVPDYAGPWNAAAGGSSDGDVGIEGNTGYRFAGLRSFTDANIPNQGTTSLDQAIVGDLNEVYLFEGTPVTRVLPQTLGQNLQTILQLYSYVTEIVRYPKAIYAIQGTGMSSISYTN